eukprot:scaffold125195_cov36-Tisochrysis_lutea.AAC.1
MPRAGVVTAGIRLAGLKLERRPTFTVGQRVRVQRNIVFKHLPKLKDGFDAVGCEGTVIRTYDNAQISADRCAGVLLIPNHTLHRFPHVASIVCNWGSSHCSFTKVTDEAPARQRAIFKAFAREPLESPQIRRHRALRRLESLFLWRPQGIRRLLRHISRAQPLTWHSSSATAAQASVHVIRCAVLMVYANMGVDAELWVVAAPCSQALRLPNGAKLWAVRNVCAVCSRVVMAGRGHGRYQPILSFQEISSLKNKTTAIRHEVRHKAQANLMLARERQEGPSPSLTYPLS